MQAQFGRVLRAQIVLTLLTAAPLTAQGGGGGLDTVRAGRFDMGRMWTFEYAPTQYFSQTYGFNADAAWFERARLSVLRIPGCSASFVSPNGLVVTNHHCVRGAITQLNRAGEALLDDGFYAAQLSAERRIPNYYADQLIAVEDVSAQVFGVTDRAADDAERQRLRQDVFRQIEQRLRGRHAGPFTLQVQIIPLYQGGRYSAYVFRRFTDVRLVAAAELQLGFFGGDADNFTYPRYALDFAFLRIYDQNGQPFRTDHHFRMSEQGVAAGDVVFVIGNPGPTTRLTTVAQLEFLRDIVVPAQIATLTSRLTALRAFYDADPRLGEQLDIRNRAFSISNTLKAATGRLDALHQPVIMAKRRDAERMFIDSVRAQPERTSRYGDVVQQIAAIQQLKRQLAREYAAFFQFGSAAFTPAILRRAVVANELVHAQRAGAPADTLAALHRRLLAVASNPATLERDFLIAQLMDLQRGLGASDSIVQFALGRRSPADAAAALLGASALADSARTHAASSTSAGITADDPAVRLASLIVARQLAFAREYNRLAAAEAELQGRLGRARFEIHGTTMPPDASSSPRITDGIVSGYEYNGTLAPPYTTFYGMYDRFHSFGPQSEWNLPARWVTPPPALNLGTPLNFVSTADTYGGNSGSPAVTPQLEVVGLNFDRNIQGLSRDYIFLPERGRNVMVDVRAIRAALDAVYDAHRILLEVNTGRLYQTEAEADAARRR
ncbi:MAG TPA: S46 family peptidase [Longimicrobiales bacterium]|nr:S46 family peptidase [Longimicrobiales bacterium]